MLCDHASPTALRIFNDDAAAHPATSPFFSKRLDMFFA